MKLLLIRYLDISIMINSLIYPTLVFVMENGTL